MHQFIESIKVEDQIIFLADLHQKRVIETFNHYEIECKIDILKIFTELNHDEDGLYKFKIWYDLNNNFRTMLIPYAISEIKSFKLVNDDYLEYNFKYEDRKTLDQHKAKSNADEVIFIKENFVTDTSFSNILFLKDKTWFTPDTYLLNGVQRQNLLNLGKIKTATITIENIKDYSHFQLINALNDFDEMFIYPIEKITNLSKKLTLDEI